MKTHGPDSLVGTIAGTMQGSSETTFYVLSVYFGSAGISKGRHAVVVGVRVLLTIHEGFRVPRDVARTHPVLATLDVLRMPQATVYRCTPAHVVALTENYNTQ